VSSRNFAKSEVIHWTGSNNEEVEGILYYPAHYEAGKKYPIITAIHGGPAGADKDLWGESWAYPIQLFTDRGALVLRPNYHGSNDYGLKWVESICCGKYYDLETPDINAGVDYLIAKGMGDPDRVGTMGWSNGSILSTSLLINYPDRYKVASVGAGVGTIAEIHVESLIVPRRRANARHFVAVRIVDQQARRKNRAVRPAHRSDAVRIAHSFRDQIIHARINIRRFEVIIFSAANGFDHFKRSRCCRDSSAARRAHRDP